MQERMHQQQGVHTAGQQQPAAAQRKEEPGDYIDFEEVKDWKPYFPIFAGLQPDP